jgi:hypothetical protein
VLKGMMIGGIRAPGSRDKGFPEKFWIGCVRNKTRDNLVLYAIFGNLYTRRLTHLSTLTKFCFFLMYRYPVGIVGQGVMPHHGDNPREYFIRGG